MGMCRCCFTREGFSTIGVVLALLIVLSLVFTSAQVYRINAASCRLSRKRRMPLPLPRRTWWRNSRLPYASAMPWSCR